MNTVYEAVEFPRGNLVLRITDGDRRSAVVVSDSAVTIQEAQQDADCRNMGAWLSEKPGESPAANWDQDAETAVLLDILDRMLIPEEKLDLLETALRKAAA